MGLSSQEELVFKKKKQFETNQKKWDNFLKRTLKNILERAISGKVTVSIRGFTYLDND